MMSRILPIFALLLLINPASAARPGARPAGKIAYKTAKAKNDGLTSVRLLSLGSEQLPKYGPSFKELTYEVIPETASRLHVKIKPTDQQRWEVPESIVQRPAAMTGLSEDSLLYDVQQPGDDQPFALKVTRKSNGQPIFDTTGHRFVFKDQYIELTTSLPEDASLYGLGEVSLPTGLLLPRDGTIITLWNRDLVSASYGLNLYGSQPFYLQVNRDGSAHGVLLLNSNGMDVILNTTSLTYKVIGGLVDLYFFLGPSPEAVMRQYHDVIGTTGMMPYWSLGAHQSKWGYESIDVLQDVVANYSAAGLPLEGVMVDIEYMSNRFRTMTYDEDRYPAARMQAFADKMHQSGQHWVPILNPGVGAQPEFRAYEEGMRDGIWIQDYKGRPYLGQIWPGAAHYPDYLASANVSSWLQRQLTAFHKQAPFDGLWLDMNEASNFCAGLNCEVDYGNTTKLNLLNKETPVDFNLTDFFMPRVTCQMKCEKPAPSNTLAHPPYKIHNSGYLTGRTTELSANSISPTARHADGSSQYDAHNLYGTAMAKKHYEVMSAMTGKRPFILSRSTFPGAGRYVAHWTGDNAANWLELFNSIAGILNTNMWGIAMAGADVCGFNDQTPDNKAYPPNKKLSNPEYEELCNRWTAAGAFYPFSRNHMMISSLSRSHEPYRWPSVAAAHRKAYGLRYQLLTYIYSSMFVAHNRGGTLARALLFTDSSDLLARNATKQWMLGEAVLISPVITPNTTRITPHFTAGTWYSAWDYTRLNVSKGAAVPLDVPLGDVAVHFRGGSILPMQPYANLTRDVRFSPVTLVVALPAKPSAGPPNGNGTAAAAAAAASKGPLPPHILDEECESVHASNAGQLVSCGILYQDSDTVEVSDNTTVQVWFTAATAPAGRSGSLNSIVKANSGFAKGKLRIKSVVIVGVPQQAAAPLPKASIAGRAATQLAAAYDADVGVVKVTGLDQDAGLPFSLSWSL